MYYSQTPTALARVRGRLPHSQVEYYADWDGSFLHLLLGSIFAEAVPAPHAPVAHDQFRLCPWCRPGAVFMLRDAGDEPGCVPGSAVAGQFGAQAGRLWLGLMAGARCGAGSRAEFASAGWCWVQQRAGARLCEADSLQLGPVVVPDQHLQGLRLRLSTGAICVVPHAQADGVRRRAQELCDWMRFEPGDLLLVPWAHPDGVWLPQELMLMPQEHSGGGPCAPCSLSLV